MGPPLPDANYVPGDGIEQNDQRYLYGGRGLYTHFWTLAGLPVESQLALETRNDQIHVALYRQVERERFFTIDRLAVDERSLGGYLSEQVFFTDWIRLEFGLRADAFFFVGFDRLPRQRPDPNFDPVRIAGRTTDSALSPKANLIITPIENTDFYLNFGEGFHSNDARNALLAKGTDFSPLTKSIGYEAGSRTRLFDRLDLAAALWLLDLDSELVFSGDAGRQETAAGGNFVPAGATRRYGVDFDSRYQLTRWHLRSRLRRPALPQRPRHPPGPDAPHERRPHRKARERLRDLAPHPLPGRPPGARGPEPPGARLHAARPDRALPVAQPGGVPRAPQLDQHRLARGTVRRQLVRAERARAGGGLLRAAGEADAAHLRRRAVHPLHARHPFGVRAGLQLFF